MRTESAEALGAKYGVQTVVATVRGRLVQATGIGPLWSVTGWL